jgi:hypothetical protein
MRRGLLLVVAMSVLLGACSRQEAASSVDVRLYEWGIDVSAPVVVAAELTVSMANGGQVPHTLVVTAADGRVVAAGPLLAPGEGGELTVALDAGVYEFTCRIVVERDGVLVDHYGNGMTSSVTAG